jgi:hypothetical protein
MAEAARIYAVLRERAREIAARHGIPAFYQDEPAAVSFSRGIFDTDPLVMDLRRYAGSNLEDDFGHGLLHATKVALDAGALIAIEGRAAGWDAPSLSRWTRMAQCAGLLHDLQRKRKDHAEHGAASARELLAAFALTAAETETICQAIRNHEAFKPAAPVETREGELVSGCLYDADKFRWGPDNFTDTLWAMVAFSGTALKDFADYYPRGMQSLARIRTTFRTPAGRQYGPQFIDLGISIGAELYRILRTEFSAELD